jgi:hypothetical protein
VAIVVLPDPPLQAIAAIVFILPSAALGGTESIP